MPTRPPRPCPHCHRVGCAEPEHRRERHRQLDQVRGQFHQRYGAAWDRLSARIRREEPWCRRCNAAGRRTLAQLVHHRDGDHTNHSRDNLEPLCKRCHGALHRGDPRAGR